MQEFIHEHTQSLHFGERVVGPLLEMGIELSKVVVLLDHAQAGEIEHSSQTRATLMGHGVGLRCFFPEVLGTGWIPASLTH